MHVRLGQQQLKLAQQVHEPHFGGQNRLAQSDFVVFVAVITIAEEYRHEEYRHLTNATPNIKLALSCKERTATMAPVASRYVTIRYSMAMMCNLVDQLAPEFGQPVL